MSQPNMPPGGNFSPETLAYLKQITQEKKSKDIQSSRKINYAYLVTTLVSGYLLYTKSVTRNNHLIKYIICNIYPLIIVQSQILGGNYNFAKINKFVVFLSMIANVITFIWKNFYLWAFCLGMFLLIGLYNVIKIVTNIKKNGIIPGMNPNTNNAYSHLQQNSSSNTPSLMDSFSQTYDPLQKIKQQQQQQQPKTSGKRKINPDDKVVYKSTNGMKLPDHMSKGMKAALKIKDQNGNELENDEPLSKRQMKLKKKFEKMQRMNGQ